MNLMELAQRIKNRRMQERITIDELARRAGLTRSMVSKVENFRVTPSLEALGRIARGLGMPMSELLSGLDQNPMHLVIIRRNEGEMVERDRPASRIVYKDLAHKWQGKSMTPLLLEVPCGVARKDLLSHEGEEFVMVIEGCVNLDYGDESHSLQAGDCAYLNSRIKHRLVNAGATTAKVLCVASGQQGRPTLSPGASDDPGTSPKPRRKAKRNERRKTANRPKRGLPPNSEIVPADFRATSRSRALHLDTHSNETPR